MKNFLLMVFSGVLSGVLAGCNDGSSTLLPKSGNITGVEAASAKRATSKDYYVRSYLSSLKDAPSDWSGYGYVVPFVIKTMGGLNAPPYWVSGANYNNSTGLCVSGTSVGADKPSCSLPYASASYYDIGSTAGRDPKIGISVAVGSISTTSGAYDNVLIPIKSLDSACDTFADVGRSIDKDPVGWWNYTIPNPSSMGGYLVFMANITIQQGDEGFYAGLSDCSLRDDTTGSVIAGKLDSSFYIQNNLPASYTIKLQDIATSSLNPDNESWSIGKESSLITSGSISSLRFDVSAAGGTRTTTTAHNINAHYGNFPVSSSGSLSIDVYDSTGKPVTDCLLAGNVFVNATNPSAPVVALWTTDPDDRVFCCSDQYYIEDNENHNHPNMLYVNKVGPSPHVTYYIQNDLPSHYYIKMLPASIGSYTSKNIDGDVWGSVENTDTTLADAGQSLSFTVYSPDNFLDTALEPSLNPDYGNFIYNSAGQAPFQIWQSDIPIATCGFGEIYINGNTYGGVKLPQIALSTQNTQDELGCSLPQFYLQDDRNTVGGSLNTLFVHYSGN